MAQEKNEPPQKLSQEEADKAVKDSMINGELYVKMGKKLIPWSKINKPHAVIDPHHRDNYFRNNINPKQKVLDNSEDLNEKKE